MLINTDKKSDVFISDCQNVMEDNLSYDKMSYEAGDSIHIDKIT